MRYTIVALSVSLMAVSCFAGEKKTPHAEPLPFREETVFNAPDTIPRELIEQINREKERFVPALEQLIANDSETLLVLVDKQHRYPNRIVRRILFLLPPDGRIFPIGQIFHSGKEPRLLLSVWQRPH